MGFSGPPGGPSLLRQLILWIQVRLNPQSVGAVGRGLGQTLAQAARQGATAAQNALGGINTSLNALGNSINRVGRLFLFYFGARQIGRFLEESIMAFARFDQKLQQSVAIMDGVTADIRKKMADTARQLSVELNISADDLAGAYYYLASAGLDAQQSIAALPAVALFAKAGMFDLARATEYLTEANTVLGYRSTDAQKNLAGMVRIMDAISKVAAKSQATIEQLVEALTNKAGDSLRLFGKDVEEGAAALAVLADRGVKGRLAGERLDIFLRQATQAFEKHRKVFQAYGIQIFDTEGKMRNLADIADDLTKALGHLSDEQQVVALMQLGFQVRTVAAVKAFIGMGDAIRKYEADARSATGFTRDVAGKQLETVAERWGVIHQKIQDARRVIGEALLPALEGLSKSLGDENNPSSLLGQLKSLGKWLGEHPQGLAKAGNLIAKGIEMVVWAFKTLTEVGMFWIQGGLFAIGVGFSVAAIGVAGFTKSLGMLSKVLTFGWADELDKIGDKAVELAEKLAKSTVDIGKSALESGRAAWENFRKGWNQSASSGGPNQIGGGPMGGALLIDTFDDGLPRGGRNDTNRTGRALDMGDAADKRARKIADLNDRLNRMIAQHTAERVDNEIQKINELEADYKAIYGNKIPAHVKKMLEDLRAQVGREGAAKDLNEMFKDIFTFNEDELTAENLKKVMDFYDRVKVLKDALTEAGQEGSVAWQQLEDLLERVDQLIKRITKHLKDKADQEEKEQKEKRDQAELDRLRKIERVGRHVAEALSDAFERFTRVLIEGSRRGADAFENLGRGILAAMMTPLAEIAMNKASWNFIQAAEDVADGIRALGSPFTAGLAGFYFTAAAKHAAVGAMWAALGGSIGGAASAIVASGHGLSRRDTGREKADKSTQMGPDIHIYVDGVDPNNPRHQQLIGTTIAEYSERTGGTITVNKR